MNDILVSNGYLSVPAASGSVPCGDASLATVLSNLAARGRVLDREALAAIRALSEDELRAWWPGVSEALDHVTGADREMETAVVYRNFPAEVIAMDRVGYVLRQIFIYFGMPYDLARAEEVARAPAEPLGDLAKLSVLALAREGTLPAIAAALAAQPSRWSDQQRAWALELRSAGQAVDVAAYAFRENGIAVAAAAFAEPDTGISVPTATDALRLAAALSEADPSLRKPPRLRKFSKAERRRLLALMEGAPNLADDLVARPSPFKRLLERLHPGTWANRFPRVVAAYDELYRGSHRPFSARLDPQVPGIDMLDAASSRPGELLRAYHRLHALFGREATERLVLVLEGVPMARLLEFQRYLWTIGNRKKLLSPPRGDWSKLQVRDNAKVPIADDDLIDVSGRIDAILAARLKAAFPEGFRVDPALAEVRFRSNAQRLAAHGAGTRFPFPGAASYVRSASYWRIGGDDNVWFDNGWNLFDENWAEKGVVTWNAERWPLASDAPAGVFSGDPAISNVEDRRGCQMIDLYPERLIEQGVRYALWGILAYSNIPFSEADDVLATLSFGNDPQAGNLFDPALAQFVFPLRSQTKRSYVAYLDLVERQIVFMDLELPASVQSATHNGEGLATLMPAVVEWLDARPSVRDLLRHAEGGTIPALYDDAGVAIDCGRAYVFRPTNEANSFGRLSLDDLIAEAAKDAS